MWKVSSCIEDVPDDDLKLKLSRVSVQAFFKCVSVIYAVFSSYQNAYLSSKTLCCYRERGSDQTVLWYV